MKQYKCNFGDLVKPGARVNWSKQERRHPYLTMEFEPIEVTGILPEEKQEIFRKLMER